jgi:hypothetical protein
MSGANFTIEGTENLKKIFAQLPENGFKKPVNIAFRKAGKPIADAMKANLPASMAGLKKIIKTKIYRSELPMAATGPFRKGVEYVNSRGVKWNPYMLLYWLNYGTMANRSSTHRFVRARDKATSARHGGIKPGLFMEAAIDQAMPQAQKIFETEFQKEFEKFMSELATK